ncbi:hypothetical protein HPB51_005487 [Rhipicephalus microplus]|uniref:V-SNARE coiled-coil homology domain-containing protein n=1 Tax=Rhipicephalus microplus TaxID=6941 RepID=A0A9J6EYA3_RHIMP|nr:hypothetical protein HPB51_005487 [Rhipicephalus microplus]
MTSHNLYALKNPRRTTKLDLEKNIFLVREHVSRDRPLFRRTVSPLPAPPSLQENRAVPGITSLPPPNHLAVPESSSGSSASQASTAPRPESKALHFDPALVRYLYQIERPRFGRSRVEILRIRVPALPLNHIAAESIASGLSCEGRSQPGVAGGQAGADQEGAPRPPNPQHQAASKRIQQTQAQVDEVVGIMRVNVEKVLERDQKLSDLDDRADALQQGASQFEQQAGKLKRKFWWKNCKMWAILIGVIAIIIIIIIVSADCVERVEDTLAWLVTVETELTELEVLSFARAPRRTLQNSDRNRWNAEQSANCKVRIVDCDKFRKNRDNEKEDPIKDIGSWCKKILADGEKATKEIEWTDWWEEEALGGKRTETPDPTRVDGRLAHLVQAKKLVQHRVKELVVDAPSTHLRAILGLEVLSTPLSPRPY